MRYSVTSHSTNIDRIENEKKKIKKVKAKKAANELRMGAKKKAGKN